ncbi:MAG: CGNR zinc finger domain-containing protein [Acidobacteriia bacterium]|nr:CGNR zinc finger domain-containing protein [Terriglobia bacterium]
MKFQIIAGDICLDFINTLDNRPDPARQQELLNSYEDLADWAMQAGAISAIQRASLLRMAKDRPQAARIALRNAIHLRECLYRLVTDLLERRRPAEADLRTFSGYLGEALSYLQLRSVPEGYRLQWTEDPLRLEFILWSIAKSASGLLTSVDSQLIRHCDAETCRWFFVDHSKNHTRRWCDMKVCGNRAKARKFYREQKRT